MLDPAELDDLQAVHNGNVDVHDDDVRRQGIDFGQSLHAVGGLAHYLTAMGGPVEQALEALPDHDLVVYQQDAQLFHRGSSSEMGSSRWAVSPPVSFSVYHRPQSRPHSSLMRFCTFKMPMLLPSNLAGWRS